MSRSEQAREGGYVPEDKDFDEMYEDLMDLEEALPDDLTEVKWVGDLPWCDICTTWRKPIDPERRAIYDGKTTKGPWAYMCQECFDKFGVGLGLGVGQRLVKKTQWSYLRTHEHRGDEEVEHN